MGLRPRGASTLWSLGAMSTALVALVVALMAYSEVRHEAKRARAIEDDLRRPLRYAAGEVHKNGVQEWMGDRLTPQVGTIQFLRHGLSVTLSAVQFRPEGLYLKGELGNPFVLTISNLALKFTAYRQAVLARADQDRDGGIWDDDLFMEAPFGEGQTNPLAELPPGGTAAFEVVVPNVKQTPEGFILSVYLSGERYGYLRH